MRNDFSKEQRLNELIFSTKAVSMKSVSEELTHFATHASPGKRGENFVTAKLGDTTTNEVLEIVFYSKTSHHKARIQF